MPDTRGNEITVSADEEAYLKAAFRRFALPYMLGAVAVFAILALWIIGRAAEPRVDVKPVLSQAVLDELKAESLALRAQLHNLLERVNSVGEGLSGASRRVDDLERRVERVTGRGGVGRSELAALTKRMDQVDRRIQQLEASNAKLEARAKGAGAPPARGPLPPASPAPGPSAPSGAP